MKTLRKWIRNLFGFSGREVNGFLILLPLMVLIILAMPLYKTWIANRSDDFSAEIRILDSLVVAWKHEIEVDSAVTAAREFFKFDPNLASVEDLEKLGFSATLSNRIATYRRKGGHFRVKSDLLKIYGVDSTFYQQLRAYIILPEEIERPIPEKKKTTTTTTTVRPFVNVRFDLNMADTTMLKSVRGIGSVLASRIIRFRDGLGGFIKPEQAYEIYGLDSAVVSRLLQVAFITDDFVPTKINVNTASEEEIAKHPYIGRSLARAIVTYRFQHGAFSNTTELARLPVVTPDRLEQIRPYLATEN